jgi:hypothetical protein
MGGTRTLKSSSQRSAAGLNSNSQFAKLLKSLKLTARPEAQSPANDENSTWVTMDGLNVKLRTFPAVRHTVDSFDTPFVLSLANDGPTRAYPRMKLEVVCLAVPTDTAAMFALDLRKMLETRALTHELGTSAVTGAVYNASKRSSLKLTLSKRRRHYELRPITRPSTVEDSKAAAFESLRRESRILFEYRLASELLSGWRASAHWGQVVKLYEGESAGFLLKNNGGYRRYRYSNVTALALETPGGDVPTVTTVEYDSLNATKPVVRVSRYHSEQELP